MLKGFGAFGIILDDITGKLSDEVIAFAVIAARFAQLSPAAYALAGQVVVHRAVLRI